MSAEVIFIISCGLALGSFVTLASHRLPLGEDIVVKSSQCPSCKTKLGFKDLWPVFSWLFSGGKCRHCKNPIGVRYPIIELLTMLLCLLIYSQFGLTLAGVLVTLFAVMLMVMVVVDIKHTIIPDMVHITLLPLGLAYHATMGTDWSVVLLGFLAGTGLGLVLHHGYRWLRGCEGLGYGDVKFFAVAGVWITIEHFAGFTFLSGLLGVVFGLVWRAAGRGRVFPFGPALAAALFLVVLYPEQSNLQRNMEQIAYNYIYNM